MAILFPMRSWKEWDLRGFQLLLSLIAVSTKQGQSSAIDLMGARGGVKISMTPPQIFI